jgi:hypothetical protein
MGVTFRDTDGPALTGAMDVLDAAIEAAHKATAKLGLSTLPVDAMASQAGRIRLEMKSGAGQLLWPLGEQLLPPLRVGLRLYADELSKVGEKQMKLSLLPHDTEDRLRIVAAIQERIAEQLNLSPIAEAAQALVDSIPEGGSMTFEAAGHEPVTIPGRKKAGA